MKWSLEAFLQKAIEIHKDTYDYSKVKFKNSHTKVIIICKIHNEFEQTPSNHMMGRGCSYCSGVGRLTKEIFLQKAKDVHGDLYEYILPDKITNSCKIKIKCAKHGIFEQTPKNHFKGQKCHNCCKYRGFSQDEFLNKCKEVHGNKYDYSETVYDGCHSNVTIICKTHGKFIQTANNHYNGNGCYKCHDLVRTTEDFIKKAKIRHSNIYDYSKVKYTLSRNSITIICKVHGEFKQKPNDHLNGSGCTKCSPVGYSNACLKWLNKIENNLGYKIQHAENGGEKKVSLDNKWIKFDGYDEKTNTVYEFCGSFWHGDLRFYNKDDINPICKKTFGELYEDTLKREELIKSHGYNLITMWEKDFK